MTPPKESKKTPTWDFSEFLKWLVHHPQALEPGLRMLGHALELGPKLSAEACAADGLGRPCLILHVDNFSASVYDRILLLMAKMQTDGERFRHLFARPHEPRMFLLAPNYLAEARARLELLTHAFSLRCFSFGPPSSKRGVPMLELEEIAAEVPPLQHLDSLGERPETPFVARLLHACSVLHPPVLCRGGDWPLLLLGVSGPLATLLRDERGVYMAGAGQRQEDPLLHLRDDDAIDHAIDALLRAQEKTETRVA